MGVSMDESGGFPIVSTQWTEKNPGECPMTGALRFAAFGHVNAKNCDAGPLEQFHSQERKGLTESGSEGKYVSNHSILK